MMRGTRYLLGWLVVAAISGPAIAQDITSNLQGHWKLTETSGTTAVDSSPAASHGTYMNGVLLASSTPIPVSGAVAAGFDGSNDYVAIPNQANYNYVGAMTVAAWIKVNAFTKPEQAIVTKGDTASWRLYRDGGNNNGVAFQCRGLTTVRVASTTSVNDGQWHHVVGVYTGTQLRIYINGTLNNSVFSVGFISTNSFPVEIGRNAERPGKEWNGWIYDVRVYNRALSAADVAHLYLQGGPLGRWKLEESSGTTAVDDSPYAHHGTYVNGVALAGSGPYPGAGEKAASFNGIDHWVSIPHHNRYALTSSLTISGWIKGNAWGSGTDVDVILRKGEANPNNYQLAITNGRLTLYLDGNDNSDGFVMSDRVLDLGEWYHVAATWNGSTVTLYINGVLDKSAARTGTIGTDTRPLYIGGRLGNDDYLNGSLYDVRIYGRALSALEIAHLYGLVGRWKLDETSGTTAADASPVANHGTYAGGVTLGADGPYPGAGAKAAHFDGANAYVSIPAPALYDVTGAIALAGWFKVDAFDKNYQTIIAKGDSAWRLSRWGTQDVLHFACNGLTPNQVNGAVDVNDGKWHHFVCMYDGSQLSMYIDGVLDSSVSASGSIATNNYNVLIAANAEMASREFNGPMYDVRIYNRALSSLEIARLYGLIGYWTLDETSGTTASDSSGLDNTASLTGTPNWTFGAVDGAHRFDYTDGSDYFVTPNLSPLAKVQEESYTLAAWFKPLSTPPESGSHPNAYYAIVVKKGGNTGLAYTRSNAFEVHHWLTGNWTGTAAPFNSSPPGKFYHVVGVVERSTGQIQIYVDGELKNTASFTPNATAAPLTAPWRIGIADPVPGVDWGWPAHGVIDDVRIYNRAISADEAQHLFDMGAGAFQGVRIINWVEIQ